VINPVCVCFLRAGEINFGLWDLISVQGFPPHTPWQPQASVPHPLQSYLLRHRGIPPIVCYSTSPLQTVFVSRPQDRRVVWLRGDWTVCQYEAEWQSGINNEKKKERKKERKEKLLSAAPWRASSSTPRTITTRTESKRTLAFGFFFLWVSAWWTNDKEEQKMSIRYKSISKSWLLVVSSTHSKPILLK